MLLRFDAEYSGAKFSEIADEVILLDIVEEPAEMDVQTSKPAGGFGMVVSSVTRRALTVRLQYVIRSQDPVRRAELQRAVARWANAGYDKNKTDVLKISTRPDMLLHCMVYTAPAQGSALRWTDELTISFVAYDLPYWVGERVNANVNATWSAGYLKYRGANVIAPVGDVARVRVSGISVINSDPENDWLTWLKIKIDDTEIVLDGIGIPTNRLLMFDYPTPRTLKIYDIFNSQENLIKYRTPESSDDLMARTGVDNQIIVEADAQVNVSVAIDGWWL